MSTTPTLSAEPVPSAGEAPRRRPSALLKGVFFNWGALVVTAVASLILTPILIRGLGAYYYGMWALVMSLVDQYGLLDMGMGPALCRFTGYFHGSEERKGLDEVFCTSVVFTLIIAAAICILTIPAAMVLPRFFEFAGQNRQTFMWLVLLLGMTTAIAFPERMMASYLRGLQRFDLFNIASTGAMLLRAALCIAAIWSGYKVLTIAVITILVGAASCAAHYLMVRIADPHLSVSLRHVRRARLRELFSFSIFVFIASLGTRLTSRVDSIVIARILTVALVTPFNVANRLMDYFSGVFGGVQGPLMSAMSELHGASKHEELQQLFVKTTKLTLLLSSLLGGILIFDGKALLALWLAKSGIDLTLTYQVLVVLTSCYVAFFAQLPAWTVIYARARHQLLAWMVLAEGAVNLGLSIYWGHKYGLLGIAIGTAVPSLTHHLLIVPWYALRVIALPMRTFLRKSVLWPVISIICFAACCFPTMASTPPFLQIMFRLILQLSAFGLFTYLIALSAADRVMVRDRVNTWLPANWLPRGQGR